ncbi:POTRA domain-containing protein, partial [Variovorax defluvii]|uniref:POTRA domain-containing protein n=1 Tax=Variovorax defluvii TaxID=913761 RepID=UPI0031E5BC4F
MADLSGPERNDDPVGRCLGARGVEVVRARAHQAVVARGYVTTRVEIAPQSLSTGTLSFSLVPGRVAAIRTTP